MTPGVLALPRFIALHGGIRLDRYLRFMDEEGDLHGHLQLSAFYVTAPFAKFELERSEKGADLMHIRSCYNNKYLVRKSRLQAWVVATADEPEEDTTKWDCTLFRIILHNANRSSYRFMHVASGGSLGTIYPVAGWSEVLHIKAFINESLMETFRIINLDSMVILPRFVTFKGPNGLYLSARTIQNRPHVQFASNDKFDPTIRYEILPRGDGSFRIRSIHFNRFLRRNFGGVPVISAPVFESMILANGENPNESNAVNFSAVKVNRNLIAVRNLFNNNFCTSLQDRGVTTNTLNALVEVIDRFCHIEVEEVVSSRRIYDVVFRTEDARIYNHSDGISLIKTVNNPTESEQDGNVSFTFTQTQTNTWNVSHGWSVSVSSSINTGIPKLVDGEIKIETSYSGNYSWGQTIQESSQDNSSTATKIPPMTKSVVTVVLTRGAIDVPFSYTQHDTLYGGGAPDIRRFHDGLFTGVNTHIHSDAVEYILPSTTLTNYDDDDQQILSSTTPVVADSTVTKDDDDDEQSLSSTTPVTKDDDDDGQNPVTKDDDADEQNLSSTTPVITDSTTT